MMWIDDLETMDRAALLAAWPETFGSPAPKGISRAFLRPSRARGRGADPAGGRRQAEDFPAGPQAGRRSAA